jgi:hypothetical protein
LNLVTFPQFTLPTTYKQSPLRVSLATSVAAKRR